MVDQRYSFRANVGLKDIIGQGLINNSNIAIIELIKNAKDAGSKTVELIFSGATEGNPDSTIIIQDQGSGMDLSDIAGKWLNIAYSEKKNRKFSKGSYYAGEKGIGRFSCDRLGRQLDLFTRKKGQDWAHLNVNWPDFEIDDADKQISDIELLPHYIEASDLPNLSGFSNRTNGTTLVIRDVRETWGEAELKKLQKELERFVIDPAREFSIYLKSYDVMTKSGKLVFDGAIENKLLSRIDEKTIAIFSEISEDGEGIRSEIRHFGEVILSYEWPNPYNQLRGIKTQIHYLSQAAKVSFKSITGYTSTDYGSVMLFLNGFRVIPYGEPKDDWLQLNERKNQGSSRFLGTRELFGLVEIKDNSRTFEPVSSREGLAHNLAFGQLTDSDSMPGRSSYAYLMSLVRTLEKYVFEGMDWDRIAPENQDFSYEDILAAVNSIVKVTSKGTVFRNVYVNEQKLREIARQKVVEVQEFVTSLVEKVSDKSVYELSKSEKRDLKRYVERHEGALAAKTEVADTYREIAAVETKKRLFAESHLAGDAERMIAMQHLIGLWGEQIEGELEDSLRILVRPAATADLLEPLINSSYLLVKKINKLSAIITKANFNLKSDNISHDIFEYVAEYVEEIKDLNVAIGESIKVTYSNIEDLKFARNFSPIEVSMMIDNIINNSLKAKAKKVEVIVHSDASHKYLDFQDNGRPLTDKYPASELFNAGISTTNGSGIGLRHIKDIAEGRGAEVSIFSNSIGGTTLRLRWGK